MIDEIDRRLREWVQETVSTTVDVSLALPAPTTRGQGVSLYLFSLSDMPPARGPKRPPLQFSLHYLISTWAEQPEEAHRLLGELAFAALESPNWEVDLEPISTEMWLACGVPPRPAFVLRVPVRRERPEPEISYVRVPPKVRAHPIQYIHGLLLGPGDFPLVDARVELIGSSLSATTDAKGYFRLAYVTENVAPRRLHIVAKGHELEMTIQEPSSERTPLVIRFDPLGE